MSNVVGRFVLWIAVAIVFKARPFFNVRTIQAEEVPPHFPRQIPTALACVPSRAGCSLNTRLTVRLLVVVQAAFIASL